MDTITSAVSECLRANTRVFSFLVLVVGCAEASPAQAKCWLEFESDNIVTTNDVNLEGGLEDYYRCQMYTNGDRDTCVSKAPSYDDQPPPAQWTNWFMLNEFQQSFVPEYGGDAISSFIDASIQTMPNYAWLKDKGIFVTAGDMTQTTDGNSFISFWLAMRDQATRLEFMMPINYPAPITQMARPRDFSDETDFASLDDQTYSVEFTVAKSSVARIGHDAYPTTAPFDPQQPPTTEGRCGWSSEPQSCTSASDCPDSHVCVNATWLWETFIVDASGNPTFVPPLPALPADPEGTIKLRGWYIEGNPGEAEDAGHGLVILLGGNTFAIADSPDRPGDQGANDPYHNLGARSLRQMAADLADAGLDVLLLDKRGHGYSEGLNVIDGSEIFDVLDQLGAGVDAVGPDGTLVHGTTLLGDGMSAATKPVVLLGVSRGANTLEKTMAMSVGAALPNEPLVTPGSYNIKGFIDLISNAGSPGWEAAVPMGAAVRSWIVGKWTRGAGLSSEVAASMPEWPAYMTVRGTNDLFDPRGGVAAYNAVTGLKEIDLYEGFHTDIVDPVTGKTQYSDKIVDFATKVARSKPVTGNTKQTTIEKEVCKAMDNAE